MATATATLINCKVNYNRELLRFLTPKGTMLRIDLLKFGAGTDVTAEENTLIVSILDSIPANITTTTGFTKEEMMTMRGIAERYPAPAPTQTANTPIPAPVVAPTPPPPVVTPTIVTPAPNAAEAKPEAVASIPAPGPLNAEQEYQRALRENRERLERERAERLAALEVLRNAGTRAQEQAMERNNRTLARVHAREGYGNIVERIQKLKTSVDKLEGKVFYQIEYDIPDRITRWCPNPAGWLWRYAYHSGLSKWTITEDEMKKQDIVDFFSRCQVWGAKLVVIKYDPSEIDKIREAAREGLRTLLIEAHTSLITGIDKLDRELEEFGPPTVADVSRRDNQVRAKLKIAGERFANALSCAELYDDSMDIADLIAGLREVIAGQQEAFNARMIAGDKAERLMVRVV